MYDHSQNVQYGWQAPPAPQQQVGIIIYITKIINVVVFIATFINITNITTTNITIYSLVSVTQSNSSQSQPPNSTFTCQIQPPAYGAAYNAQGGGISMQVPMQAPRWPLSKMKNHRIYPTKNKCNKQTYKQMLKLGVQI